MTQHDTANLTEQAYDYLDNGDLTSAKALFEQICQLDAGNAEVWMMLGAIQGEIGDGEGAIASLGRAITLQPDNAEAHYSLGRVLHMSGRHEEALKYYQQAVKVDPGFADAWMSMGVVNGMIGEFYQAEFYCRQAVRLQPESAQAHMNLANVLLQQGKIDEAIDSYTTTIALQPKSPLACYMLAKCYLQAADIERAEASCRQAINLDPNIVDVHFTLGDIYRTQNRIDEAIEAYRRVVALQSDHPDALRLLALLYAQTSQNAAAVDLFERLLAFKPTALAHYNLGNALAAQGKMDEAIVHYEHALLLDPDCFEAHNNLGNALAAQKKVDLAIASYERALSLNPDDANAHTNLGNALMNSGRLAQAIVHHQQAVTLRPNFSEAHNNLGNALAEQGEIRLAIASYERALLLKPDYAEAHNNLGNALAAQEKADLAIASYERALLLKPDYAEAHNNLGNALAAQGELELSIASYKRALSLSPDDAKTHNNLLWALNYSPDSDPMTLYNAHLDFAKRQETPFAALIPAHANDFSPERRLRIGYVSPDFRIHPVAYFMEPILRNHDPAKFEVFCYAEVNKPDAVTERLRGFVLGWRNTCGLSDAQLVKIIQEDEIDILVDLAGHTGSNRLTAFVFKPAPVQVSYLGYPNTTGLATMDYRLTDEIADPPGSDAYYSEELCYLPGGFSCYQPAANAPDVTPLPARARGFVTFASFTHLSKINDEVLDLWCRVLRENPTSRLFVYRHLLKGKTKDRYYQAFEARGIGRNRVILESEIPAKYQHLPYGKRHMGLFEQVDLILDTFPWNNHTISCETLWMGIPVVTLAGDRHAGRICASVLTAIGLPDLIAQTPDEYVNIATGLANNLNELEQLRSTLRSRMKNSPLCDGMTFTRTLENTYRGMWKKWCGSRISLTQRKQP